MLLLFYVLAILFLLIPPAATIAPKIFSGDWLFMFMFVYFPAFWLLSGMIFLGGLLCGKNKYPFLALFPFLVLPCVYIIPKWTHFRNFGIILFCGLLLVMLIMHIIARIIYLNRNNHKTKLEG